MIRKAVIYQPAKSAMQSGIAKTNHWLLKVLPTESKSIDPTMGWVTSNDTHTQVIMKFNSKDAAVKHAETMRLSYEVLEPNHPHVKPKSYASNFIRKI
jgi:NADH dehydrogenase